MKTLITTLVVLLSATSIASATIPRATTQNRSNQIAREQHDAAAAAQARANATGQPQFANGGVYTPVKP